MRSRPGTVHTEARGRRRRLLGGAVLVTMGLVSAPSIAPVRAHAPDPATSTDLALLGQTDLGGKGLNGEVAIVGNTAVVATGIQPAGGLRSHFYNPYPCATPRIQLVDISNPAAPARVGQIQVEQGITARDVAAIHVTTPTFTGDLLAVALARCGLTTLKNNGFEAVARGVAYYDITKPSLPRFLGRYQADLEQFNPEHKKCDETPPSESDPNKGPDACASSQDAVSLVQRGDGRVLSISTEPFATASRFTSGDLRIVDVTDPTNPVQVGDYNPPNAQPPAAGFSNNGCRPFTGIMSAELYAGGTKAVAADMDDGLLDLNVALPAGPPVFSTGPAATLAGSVDPYPVADRRTEGNASFATVGGPGESLALFSDQDWNAPDSSLRIATVGGSPSGTSPQGLAAGSSIVACEAPFTLFDPENTAQVYRRAGAQVPADAAGLANADLVYVGRGCPADAYLTDPATNAPFSVAGKIAVVDRGRTAFQTGQIAAAGCSLAARATRAQAAGAIGVAVDANFFNNAFGPDGVSVGIDIPMIALDRPGATRLRTTLCPSVSPGGSGNCTLGTAVTGAMVDSPGAWGGLRIADLASHAQVGQYSTARSQVFPPPDLGVYSVHHAVTAGSRAYVAWNSDGVRILDISNPAAPVEVGHFVPPDTADPTATIPAKAYVTGVAVSGCKVVITDINSGLYVLRDPAVAC